LNSALLHQIVALYGLPPATFAAPEKGYRNSSFALTLPDGRMLNFILYKHEAHIAERIQRANRTGDFLAAQAFPARRTVDPRILRLLGPGYTRYGALYEYLPGATIPWEGYTMKHIKSLGATMSHMHKTLATLPQGELPSVIDESQALAVRMRTYFAQPGVQRALRAKLKLTPPPIKVNFKKYQKLPAGALHMDFVRGNILFDNKAAITGVLDFEKTAWGPVVFDIARTLAFLLVDCKYKPEEKIRKYFLHSGYNKRGQAKFDDWAAMEKLVDFFLIHDFYKFLRHNPYESLPQNEHFTRTRGLLLKRNILSLAQDAKINQKGRDNGDHMEKTTGGDERSYYAARAIKR
jgi:Ser/Thr protein kinase RdoA (MazF antagonist)